MTRPRAKAKVRRGLGLALLAAGAHASNLPLSNERLLELRLRDRTVLSDGMLVLEKQGRRYLPSEEFLRYLGFLVETLPEKGVLRAKIFSDTFNLELDLTTCRVRWLENSSTPRSGDDCLDLLSYESDIFISENVLVAILGARFSVDELKSLLVAEFERPPPVVELRQREQEQELQALIRGQVEETKPKPITLSESAGVLPPWQGPRLEQSLHYATGSASPKENWALSGEIWTQAYTLDAQYAYVWNTPGQLSQSWQISKEDPERKMGGALGLSRVAAGDVYIPTVDLVTESRKLEGVVLSSFSLDAQSEERRRSFSGRTTPNAYVELYHNGALIEAQRANEFGDYLFSEVVFFPGANSIELRFSGTQGERDSKRYSYFVSPDSVGKRSFVYQVAKGRDDTTDITFFAHRTRLAESLSLSGSVSRFVEDTHTQLFYLQTQIYGSMRFVSWDVAAVADNAGDWATQMQTLAGWESVRLRTRWQHGNGSFTSPSFPALGDDPLRDLFEASLSFPIWHHPSLGLRFGWRREERLLRDKEELFLSQTISYQNYFLQHDFKFLPALDHHSGTLIAEKGWHGWRFRSDASYESGAWKDAGVSVNFRSPNLRWTGQASYRKELSSDLAISSLSGSRDLTWSRLLAGLEVDSEKMWQSTLSLEFSLERKAEGLPLHMASGSSGLSTSLRLFVFEDSNSNGVYDDGETPVEGLRILVNKSEWKQRTSALGEVLVAPLGHDSEQTLQIHPLDLMKLGLQASSKTFYIRNPARTHRALDVPLIRVAELEGYLVEGSGASEVKPARYRNLYLEETKTGRRYTTRADREGYFIFDEVPRGRYRLYCERVEVGRLLTETEIDPLKENYVPLGNLLCQEPK